MAEERRLAAILAADVVGYSRLIGADEAGTLAALKARRKDVLEPLVAKNHGRIFKVMGDGVLVEFGSPVDAVRCAVAVQQGMAAANAGAPEGRRIVLRIGVNLGDVVVEGGDRYGDGVNIAARLEGVAEPGGVVVSGTTYDHVQNKLKIGFDDLGTQNLKNIAEPVRAYRVSALAEPKPFGSGDRAASTRPSIAVLPFTNMSGDSEQQYLSDGIAEDIITELSRFRELLVIARNSSSQYRDKAVDVKRIGQELGADYLVEGSIRKTGSRVRITAQLIDASSGSHLWAEHYDRDLNDIFVILDEVTRTIVASLFGRLADSTTRLASRKTASGWRAYDLLLQARARISRYDLAGAELLVRRVVEIDPTLALAHALQASIHLRRYYDNCLRETLGEALTCAQKALSLDENDGYCHSIAAAIYLFTGDFDSAISHSERAVDLNPSNTDFLIHHAMVLARVGRSREAVAILDIVKQRDPFLSAQYWGVRSNPLLQERRYVDAIHALNQISQKPLWVHAYLAVAYAHLGRVKEARSQIAEVLRLQPQMTINRFSMGEAWQNPGDLEQVLNGLRKAGLPE